MKLSSFLTHQPFWGLLTLAVLVWYSTVTIYVAVRGVLDIRAMLRRLRQNHPAPAPQKKVDRSPAAADR
ncbi:MAG: hypothetical protein N3I86_10510 [Verrucomicrobiae bacterium]|nr:hypothetical protein [Verrucomicrobiae bacterium]